MRPKGIVRLFQRGRLLWECENLFVNSGLVPLANLIAGVSTGQFVSAVGFGSSGTPPTAADTGLGGAPEYYNAINSYTFPSSGSVEFTYSLQVTDYGANGMTIQELGLFANSAPVGLPAAIGTANPAWTANASETVGNLIVDSNGNIQRCTVAGTTGASAPAWSSTVNGQTPDGTCVWTLVALHAPPAPMIAHVAVPAFTYSGGGNYSGTWTLTF